MPSGAADSTAPLGQAIQPIARSEAIAPLVRRWGRSICARPARSVTLPISQTRQSAALVPQVWLAVDFLAI